MSVFVVRAFIRMRQMLIEQRGLARKLAELEKELTARLDIHETAINEMFTPLLHKNAFESTAFSHQKAVSTLLRIISKGHHWIDPGDDIDLTVIPLWVSVG